MASLSLRHIYKIYQGGVKAVSDFNLEIDDKEFIVFVGPSGCGKSTTLRMVAGLEEISAGELYIDGKLVNDVEPKDRDIAMVFQNYALYPHMTVYDNMAFGLRLRKMPSAEIDARVQEAAAILGITPLLSRKPKALSGGQRQRVALGRAIVREPKVFLLDEPLSNLDAKLRVQMRTEITKIHNRLATTFIYVTHDQTEAMTMGTRIVVMKDGIVQQIDTPSCLYDNPENLFVASFLGSPQMNFFKAQLIARDNKIYVQFGENEILVPETRAKRIIDKSYIGREVVLGIRPEDIHDEEVFIANSPDTIIKAEIDVLEKLGNETILYMKVGGKEDYTVARIDARCTAVAGDNVKLAVDANHIHFFDPDTELTIMGAPKANRIPAKLLATANGLVVRFGNVIIPISSAIANKLTTVDCINKDVMLEIAPADLMQEAEDGSVKIEGMVDFIEKFPRYTAVYSQIAGKDGFLVAKLPVDSEIARGDKYVAYVDPNKIQLRDIDGTEKLIAFKPVTKNTTTALVTIKENIASIAFGKSKIQMVTNNMIREQGSTIINIDPRYIRVGKEAIAKSPKTVVSGKVKDADVLGANTIIYADVEGFDAGFCAIVPGTVNYNINDKVKFVIDPMGITAGKLDTIDEVIANSVASAPAYTFVEAVKAVKADAKAEVSADAKAEVVATKKPAAKKAETTTKTATPKPKTTTKK